jgi:CHASE3 domain sensor protein
MQNHSIKKSAMIIAGIGIVLIIVGLVVTMHNRKVIQQADQQIQNDPVVSALSSQSSGDESVDIQADLKNTSFDGLGQ